MCKYRSFRWFLIFILPLLVCFGVSAAHAAMDLNSSAFAANGSIPTEFTCSGEGKSPPLAWSGVPASAVSLVLIVSDLDAPMGNFVHWVIFNIPGSISSLPEGIPSDHKTGFGAIQGVNSNGETGYMGPCPPPTGYHHYHFRLYAIDRKLSVNSNAGAGQVQAAMRGHIVGEAELVGIYSRSLF